jgi:hypothetical protein
VELLMTGTGLNEGMRVFSYSLSGLLENTTSSLPFVDSTGEEIYCNYFKVVVHFHAEAASYDPQDHTIAFIEIPNQATNGIDTLHTPFSTTTDVSGFCGLFAIARGESDGVAEWKSPNDTRINGIKIHLHEDYSKEAGEIFVYLTYGNITPFNLLRQDRYDRGA